MTTVAEVKLWGSTIGVVSISNDEAHARFEYDAGFLNSGIELSPILMPLSSHVYSFPQLSTESFHGLPVLLSDSLPDKFGNTVIDSWLISQGRAPGTLDPVERLCYTGSRGMGALEYAPAIGPDFNEQETLHVDELVNLASRILSQRSSLSFQEDDHAMQQIIQVGTSAGGARAKALIAWNEATGEIRSGQIATDPDFGLWLMKFDGVTDNGDKEGADAPRYTVIEYAFHLMAKAAGIDMMECRLYDEGDRRHFLTRRFDRAQSNGDRIHMQTLAGIAGFDYNQAGAHSYEEASEVMRKLGLGQQEVEELFRRMVLNVIAQNNDDHVKNLSFLMDRSGTWRFAPAYDVTYAYKPGAPWTGSHQMSINGMRSGIELEDLTATASFMNIKRRRATDIIAQVGDAVGNWTGFAEDAGLSSETAQRLESTFLQLN